MISTAQLAATLLEGLHPDVRNVVESHFFDGESLHKI
jgi:hypothetical protein